MTVTTAKRPPQARIQPDQRKLTELQAERLAKIADLDTKDLVGLTTAEISEKFRFHIEPELLLYRKVCGRVVKTDPVTGIDYPVPFATVHVQDTDCSLLGYFPVGSPWAWYFPFRCRREDIATAKTDECGNFCAWVPRWDIDHLLRWRHQRFCFPLAFERPSLRDILDDLQPIPKIPPIGPGPVELPALKSAEVLKQLEDRVGRNTVAKLQRLGAHSGFGEVSTELDALLDTAVHPQRLAPPLPKEFRGSRPRELLADAIEEDRTLFRDTLSERLQVDAAEFEGLELRNYIGPFKRCIDVLMPMWTTIIDVPDITFRVTQDTDGDGDEETIYSEGYFQVRWNAGPLGPVTLHANQTALAGQLECLHHGVPCGTEPAIVMAGMMPVSGDATLYDAVNGYVLRANRPHTSGGIGADPMPNPAATPFYGNVSLFGCNKTNASASHYRLVYKYSDDDGATFTDYQPMTGREWWLYRVNSGTGLGEYRNISSDANGWYPIAVAGDSAANPFLPRDKLMDWPSNYYADGRYVFKVDLGNGSGAVLQSSAEIAFNIDNSAPYAHLTVEWKRADQGDAAFQALTGPCPVVRRGSSPHNLEFRVTIIAGARHLRSVLLDDGDCGGGEFADGAGETFHWHQNTGDNTETLQKRYTLSAVALQGTYSFGGKVSSRAISPTGYDNGHLQSPPWQYDPEDIYALPRFAFSVINSD